MNHDVKVLAQNLAFPEGPAFDPAGDLWFVELHGGNLVRWRNGRLDRYPTGGAPNGLAFDQAGRAWFCDAQQNAIRRFDPSTGIWETVVDTLDGRPLNKPNDLAFDSAGQLVFTCPGDSRQEPSGYVCCLHPDGSLTRIAGDMFFPNGLAFMDGDSTLVIAETYRQRLWRGQWDVTSARWVEAKPWADLGGQPGPDGMALGADGLLYVAVVRSGQIKVIDAEGQFVRGHKLPGQKPTNAAFDPRPERPLGLVVTEAERGLLLGLPKLGPGAPLFNGG